MVSVISRKIDVDFSLLPHLFETRDVQEAARETRVSTLTKAVSGYPAAAAVGSQVLHKRRILLKPCKATSLPEGTPLSPSISDTRLTTVTTVP